MRLDIFVGLGLVIMAIYTIYAVTVADHLFIG